MSSTRASVTRASATALWMLFFFGVLGSVGKPDERLATSQRAPRLKLKLKAARDPGETSSGLVLQSSGLKAAITKLVVASSREGTRPA